jgi:phosphatidyl-myo-inositol dimannoside synthase
VINAWTRAIILTPSAGGADGVSAVTRVYAEALTAQLGRGVGALEIWTLGDTPISAPAPRKGVVVRAASGSRLRFASFALRAGRVDSSTLVIVQHVHLLPVALPLMWRGARIVLQLHGVEAWKRLRVLERAGCRAAWKIAAVSAHTAARFRTANPQHASQPVEICPPGVPGIDIQGGAGVGAPYALIVGRMASAERYKGHDVLLDIWAQVRRSVPDAQLVIVGGGDDRDRLADKAMRLGLAHAVRFEGVVANDRLAALYRDAAVFVMPSANEGFGLVYVEAMLAGVPCVVAAGAAEEIVEHGATGMVVAPGDAAALEQAIVRLLTNRDERQRMGAAAAETARRRFSLGAFAARLYTLLQLPQVHPAC